MHALKTPSFLRPSSRSSSPAPSPMSSPHLESAMLALDPMARPTSRGPLNRLALSSRKRPVSSPPPSTATPTLVQDGSYLEALSLKLSEAVSKALAQPSGPPVPGEVYWNGKRALPKGRGNAFGALIGSELEASASNPHLHRAIQRSLHRPLSVLLTNLSAQLLPLISSPQFALNPTPSVLNPTQLYTLSYATFAAELLEGLDARGLVQRDTHGAADNLRSIRDGLESLIGRVINPLSHGITKDLLPLIEALGHNTVPASSPTHPKPPSMLTKNAIVHPSITSLQNLIPAHARNLVQYTTPPTMTSQTMLATLLISLIWRSLVALSHRAPVPVPSTPGALGKKRVVNSTTPPTTPPASRFSIKLPPSRPPSPPPAQIPCPATDAQTLFALINMLPRPNEHSQYALAREAVDEACSGFAGLCALLDCETAGEVEGAKLDLDGLTAELPTVIALPVLLRMFLKQGEPWDILGLTEEEYRDACLGGFGKAEECGPAVAKRVLENIEGKTCEFFVQWLESRASLGD